MGRVELSKGRDTVLSYLIEEKDDECLGGVSTRKGDFSEPLVVEVTKVGTLREGSSREDKTKMRGGNESVSRSGEAEDLLSVEFAFGRMWPHLKVASILGKMRKWNASPVYEDGRAGVVKI